MDDTGSISPAGDASIFEHTHLVGSELQRVDKYGPHDYVALRARLPEDLGMAIVQSAHGWHESHRGIAFDRPAGPRAFPGYVGTQFCDAIKGYGGAAVG